MKTATVLRRLLFVLFGFYLASFGLWVIVGSKFLLWAWACGGLAVIFFGVLKLVLIGDERDRLYEEKRREHAEMADRVERNIAANRSRIR